jgi:hypothetical protein
VEGFVSEVSNQGGAVLEEKKGREGAFVAGVAMRVEQKG